MGFQGLNDMELLEKKVLLLPGEVAKILRVSKRTVYRMVKYGYLEGKTLPHSKTLRITSRSVMEWLEQENELGP